MEFNFAQNMEAMFEKFEKFVKERTVIGEPIQMGNITMIPASTISFGMANAGGDGRDDKANANGTSGGGLGAKIVPTAMIVIKGENVEILPISKGHAFEKLVEMVPSLMEKIDLNKKCGE